MAYQQFTELQSILADDSWEELDQLEKQDRLEKLENHVKTGIKILDELRTTLTTSSNSADMSPWVDKLEQLKLQSVPQQTVIGVVGSTGTGKSSLINALLDEERLVPTSCYRACTAVVTEIAYNHSMRKSERYRAEIEFLTSEEWGRELALLKEGLLDEKGKVSYKISKAGSEAGVAWSKIKAVYPNITKEQIANTSLEDFLATAREFQVLGTVKPIIEQSADKFCTQVQQYIGNTEKRISSGRRPSQNGADGELGIEFWPLIKVVRVFTKSNALSTGAKIVDLPGTRDSNAARAKVAENYLQKCTAIWIVAPITRAVSDEDANDYLHNTHTSLQMKYDGSFAMVTFIASKTDEINVSEARQDLNISEEHGMGFVLADAAKEKVISNGQRLGDAEQGLENAKQDFTDITFQLENWRSHCLKQGKGENVCLPKSNPHKRATSAADVDFIKSARRKIDGADGSVSYKQIGAPDGVDVAEADPSSQTTAPPLSHEQIRTRSYEDAQIEASKLIAAFEAKVNTARKECQESEHKFRLHQDRVAEICIQARNDESRNIIQRKFAERVQEIDEDCAAEGEIAEDDEPRDYDELARSLPVFCVSAIAYQILKGRCRNDGVKSGFRDVGQTEIPQLQQHAIRMTVPARADAAKKFLNCLLEKLNSLSMWTQSQIVPVQPTETGSRMEMSATRDNSIQLRKDLAALVNKTMDNLKNRMNSCLFSKFGTAARDAKSKALATVATWATPLHDGGLSWITYRAICRHGGSYTGSGGYKNFNEDLIEPQKLVLGNAWELVFNVYITRQLANLSSKTQRLVKDFHDKYKNDLKSRGCKSDIKMLDDQMKVRHCAIQNLAADFSVIIKDLQKGANREFSPVISAKLKDVYESCAAETGPGMFNRMKKKMHQHIDGKSKTVFTDSCSTVKSHLLEICDQIEHDIHENMDDMVESISLDYQSVLSARKIPVSSDDTESGIQAEVQKVLSRVNGYLMPASVENPAADESAVPKGPKASSWYPSTWSAEARERSSLYLSAEL